MRVQYWITIVGLLAGSQALAQPGFDSDGDGLVSRAEFEAAAAERFERLDANGDGMLSRDELRDGALSARGRMAERRGERFAAIDTDGDGAWSLAELQAVRPELTQERFAQMDADGDGLISEDERPMRGWPMRGHRGPPPR